MPWQIWSPEDFPKRNDEGALVDYALAYGEVVLLEKGKWTPLAEEGFYTKSYCLNWVDKRADEKEITVTAKDIAERISRNRVMEFGGVQYPVGLMFCNSERSSPEQVKALEVEGERRNLVYRKKTVEAFEVQFRVKSQGGPGRWTPTNYEKECYDMLGMLPPEVVNRPATQAPAQVQIIQPDPAMFAAAVAAEVAKQLAAHKPAKVI